MNTRQWVWAGGLLLLGAAAQARVPTSTSVRAAKATAQSNPLCTAITPFYWEIGDSTGTLVSASEGVDSTGAPVLATTKMNIASSAKWLYGDYVVQLRGAAHVTAQDINFLTMTSGYSNMGGDNQKAGTCPPSDEPDTINVCLTLINPTDDLPYSYQNPASIGLFDYDAGHDENHASRYTGIGNTANAALGSVIAGQLGTGVSLVYSQPLLAGGANMTPASYAHALQNIVSGSQAMFKVLGTHPVCTLASATCNALTSPIPWAWHYSIGHWVEDDPSVGDDGAFSSPGKQGFYPWIEASKQYYGLIGRVVSAATATGSGTGEQGVQSAQCGQLIRHAWDTGIQQKTSVRTGTQNTAKIVEAYDKSAP